MQLMNTTNQDATTTSKGGTMNVIKKVTLTAFAGIALAVGIAVATPSGETPRADAMSPAQGNAWNTVVLLANNNAGSIDAFWRLNFAAWGETYTQPRVFFYNSGFGQVQTNCGSTAAPGMVNNGFYCGYNEHSIYLSYSYMQQLLNTYGDFATGGFLAHEWGHAVQQMLGYANRGYRSEYHADCLAGMYARFGYSTGRLTGGDYWEFYGWLNSRTPSYSHGTAQGRTAWFNYGYQTYSLSACNAVFN